MRLCLHDGFTGKVDGRGVDGHPLPMISRNTSLAPLGSGDSKVQAYNFRLCLTRNTSNWAPFPPPNPDLHDPNRWELLRRVFAAKNGTWGFHDFFSPQDLPPGCKHAGGTGGTGGTGVGCGKTDTNNAGGLGTDYVGGSWTWPNVRRLRASRLFTPCRHPHPVYLHFLFCDIR